MNKNIQQPKVWPTSPNAHRLVMGKSPLYASVLQEALGKRAPEEQTDWSATEASKPT
jgi:hypothetical protein